MSYFVYLLECTNGLTYVGATVDLDKRLRQHNNEICGGASTTTIQVKRGYSWKRICYVRNFPTWVAALQFEWRWKQITRRLKIKTTPTERRKDALVELLSMERPTKNSTPYEEWNEMPEVVTE